MMAEKASDMIRGRAPVPPALDGESTSVMPRARRAWRLVARLGII
jgi:hypothetical protein